MLFGGNQCNFAGGIIFTNGFNCVEGRRTVADDQVPLVFTGAFLVHRYTPIQWFGWGNENVDFGAIT
jgi:hypothetical protein